MAEAHHQPPGLTALVSRLARTASGALHNRLELLALEWQEERARLAELLFWTVGLMFLGILGTLLLTATIIFLFAPEMRLYVAAGFTVLYLAGTTVAWFSIKSLLKHEAFTETLHQAKEDRAWLESLK